MGLGIGFSCSRSRSNEPRVEYVSIEREIAPKDVDTGANPNPYNFKIVWACALNGNTIMRVNYPNCTTFGGDKLLLLRGIWIKTQHTKLDPHFFEGDHPVIARFRPDAEGARLAEICARAL